MTRRRLHLLASVVLASLALMARAADEDMPKPAPSPHTIGAAKLIVGDLAKTQQFFETMFGMKEVAHYRADGLYDEPIMGFDSGARLALFQPRKTGNMDCTFCLDCVQACPHDNVGVTSRLPASELIIDPPRSGIGFFSRRKDLAALVIVFTFGALLNAFGMVSPIYALQNLLANLLRLNYEAPVLGVIFIHEVYAGLAMPQFDNTLLGLLGISSGTYLGLKTTSERTT